MSYDPKVRTAASNRARLRAQSGAGPATPALRASILAALDEPEAGPPGGIADRIARRLLGMDGCDCDHLTEHEQRHDSSETRPATVTTTAPIEGGDLR